MNDGDKEILEHYVRTREKTLDLLRRVPDAFLGRQPEGEDMPMASLFAHTGCAASWWMANVMKDGGDEEHPWPRDKEGLIRAIEEAAERVTGFFSADDGAAMGRIFEYTDPPEAPAHRSTGRNRLLYLIDHEVHHRGKIVLALRQFGWTDIPFLPF